ncbi:MAG: hypothetical protein WCT36_05575, partial [Candidatus Gracilibacteria bacterium]
MAVNKILDDSERKLVTDMAEAKIAEAMEKKDVDAVLLKIAGTPATAPDQLLTIFKSIDTWLSTRAGTDPNEKQKVLAEVYEIIMEQVGRAIIVERKLKDMKDTGVELKVGDLDYAKLSEADRKALIGEHLWTKEYDGKEPEQKQKLGQLELVRLSEDERNKIITAGLLKTSALSKDAKLEKLAKVAEGKSGAEREAMLLPALLREYETGARDAVVDLGVTKAAWSSMNAGRRTAKIKEKALTTVMMDPAEQKDLLIKQIGFTLSDAEIDAQVGAILLSEATEPAKLTILGTVKFDSLSVDERKKAIVDALISENSDVVKQKALLADINKLSIDKKRGLVANVIWTEMIGGATGDAKANLIKDKLEEAIKEARSAISNPGATL